MKTTNRSLMGISAKKAHQLSKKEATKVKGGGDTVIVPEL